MTTTSKEDPFWNAALETLETSSLQDLELELLNAQLDYLEKNSPFYKEKLKENLRGHLSSIDEIRKLPFTVKDELRAS